MKPKFIITLLLFVGLAAGVVVLGLSNQQKDAELAKLRADTQASEAARTEADQARTTEAEAQNAEIARLRKDNEDLLRLRNEVRQLRDDKQQLAKQLDAQQTETQRAQSEAQRAQTLITQAVRNNTQQAQQLQQLQAQDQELRTLAQQSQQAIQFNTCMNNLRQLDAAKQQWALENRKAPTAVPTLENLAPYLPPGAALACPAGGTYTLNAVNAAPTCSVPGHTLPQ